MTHPSDYFTLARNEEISGNKPAALLFYLSSFCASFNSNAGIPTGTVEKIRRLQNELSLSDEELLDLVHSYGALTDQECQCLLLFSIQGYLDGIYSVLSGGTAYGA